MSYVPIETNNLGSACYQEAEHETKEMTHIKIRDSIVVSISACHAEDPGSIPGRGASRVTSTVGLDPRLEGEEKSLQLYRLDERGRAPSSEFT